MSSGPAGVGHPGAGLDTAAVGRRRATKMTKNENDAAGSEDPVAALFHDGKASDALRTIGEVARALGLRQHVLRYWEEQFPMLTPLTRAGGRRYYRREDIALLIRIDHLLNREGYTIRGARQALSQEGTSPRTVRRTKIAPPPAAVVLPEPEGDAPELRIIAALTALRQHLAAIRDRLEQALAQD